MDRHLLWHLIRFDFRAQRLLLAAWAGALLIQALVFAIGSSAVDYGQPAFSWDMALVFVRGGLMMAVVSYVVQSDPVVGTHAFWMTRPIPRMTMLASKVLPLVGWLVLLPAVVAFATLSLLGLRAADSLVGAWTLAFEQGFTLAAIVMAAVVTANLAQLVVAGIAGFMVVALLNALVLPAVTVTWPALGDELGGWQPAVYGAWVCVGALIVAVHQYRTLRAWRSLALICLTMTAAGLATQYWGPRDPLPNGTSLAGDTSWVARATIEASDLKSTRMSWVTRSAGGPDTGLRRIWLETRPAGVPDDVALWPVAARSEWTVPGRAPVRWQGWLAPRVSRDQVRGGMPNASAFGALAGDRPLGDPIGSLFMSVVADVSAAEYLQGVSSPPGLAVDLTSDAYRYRIAGRLPLVSGSTMSAAGRSVVVTGVRAWDWKVEVLLKETLLDESALPRETSNPIKPVWVFRNTTVKEAAFGGWTPWHPQKLTMGFASTSLVSRQVRVEGLINDPALTKWEKQAAPVFASSLPVDQWVKGAELLLLVPEKIGIVTLPLRLARLELPPPPAVR